MTVRPARRAQRCLCADRGGGAGDAGGDDAQTAFLCILIEKLNADTSQQIHARAMSVGAYSDR